MDLFMPQLDLLFCHLSRPVLVPLVRRLLDSSLLWPILNYCAMMRFGNVKAWILYLTLLLDLSTVLLPIAISLLELDMLLPRLLLCYLLCLDYLFLLARTVPPSLGIALARLILSSFPLSSLSSLLLFPHYLLTFPSPSLPLFLSSFLSPFILLSLSSRRCSLLFFI